MLLSNWRNILVIVLSWTSAAVATTCQSTRSKNYGVTWPSTETETISQPACINGAMEFAYRQCNNGVWAPEPDCPHIQPDRPPECPEGFSEVGDLCLILSEKSSFPPTCPYHYEVSFHIYENYVNNAQLGPVWMPVRRNTTYSLGVLQWTEHSFLYKESFNGSYVSPKRTKGLDCLLYYNSSYVSLVSCEEKHSGVCAYVKLHKLEDQFCGSYRQTDYSDALTCLYISNDCGRGASLKPYQNHIYGLMTSHTCNIGISKEKNGSYVWEQDAQPLIYSYWSKNVSFEDANVYGAMTSDGWILTKDPLYCCLAASKWKENKPLLSMSYNLEDFFSLSLTIYNLRTIKDEILIRCCTDALPDELIFCETPKILSGSDESLYIPTFKGIGHYWCEVAGYENDEFVQSQVILRNPQNVSVIKFIVQTTYKPNQHPLTLSGLKSLYGDLMMADNLPKNGLKIMKVLYLDEDNNTVMLEIWISPDRKLMKRYIDLRQVHNVNIIDWDRVYVGDGSIA